MPFFPTMPTTGSSVLYGTLCAIIPAVAYPFLPSRRPPHQDGLTGLNILPMIIQFLHTALWAHGIFLPGFPFWVFPFSIFYVLVAAWTPNPQFNEANWRPGDETELLKVLAMGAVVIYKVVRLIGSLVAEGGWFSSLRNTVCSLVVVALIMHVLVLFNTWVSELAKLFNRLATRDVPAWRWIRAREEQREWIWWDFVALWSFAAEFVLFVLWAAAVLREAEAVGGLA